MSYKSENQVKANFEDVYGAPTPHAYFAEMQSYDYRIAEQAKPYFHSAIELIRQQNGPELPVRMLDLGCSYGVGSALVKYGFSLDKVIDFFTRKAPRDSAACIQATRDWLTDCTSLHKLKCVGADCSAPAIRFALAAGLIDEGIAHNFETGAPATEQQIRLLEQCSLLTSTGAIGYVGKKTLSAVLPRLGRLVPAKHGPYAVVTILRMFDTEPIAQAFEQCGFAFQKVPNIRLLQRHFVDEIEQAGTVKLLRERGVDPEGWESDGILYAELYAAAPPKDMDLLMTCLQNTIHPLVNEVRVNSAG